MLHHERNASPYTLKSYREDLAGLSVCQRDDIAHLDWSVWTSSASGFAPGRHALFGSTTSDRVLIVAPTAGGTTYRMIIGTLSWFELQSRTKQPRPVLERATRVLNELEGTAPRDGVAWRCEAPDGPSPELWFGDDSLESFCEHSSALHPSALEASRVRRVIADVLREALPLPS